MSSRSYKNRETGEKVDALRLDSDSSINDVFGLFDEGTAISRGYWGDDKATDIFYDFTISDLPNYNNPLRINIGNWIVRYGDGNRDTFCDADFNETFERT